tara:strand:+ start:2844 stop:3077 length:234 start_codon:yes stop_codon:yes gene_type:complete
MKTKNILDGIKIKSIKETKKEIDQILEKLESQNTNLYDSINDYKRLIDLNKHVDTYFKKKSKKISLIGKKIKKSRSK